MLGLPVTTQQRMKMEKEKANCQESEGPQFGTLLSWCIHYSAIIFTWCFLCARDCFKGFMCINSLDLKKAYEEGDGATKGTGAQKTEAACPRSHS